MPESIAQYRLIRQIGRGGMGIVFEAHDDRLQRRVALKTILPSADPGMRDRFLREARAAAAVSHPHVCQLFEIGEHNGEPFLAMELLEGESLAERLERGPLPTAEALTVALGVLSALEALHRRGIVHRDLKPSNVFLTSHGVKLLDFGLARPVALDVDATSLTLPGVLLGTPRYMAPEQARGLEVDARADLFAAGALLFETLSGRPAFPGSTAVDVLHAVLHDQPPALVGSMSAVDVDRVIQRALAKIPAERFQSADEMARELRACLSRADVGTAVVAHAATRLMVLPFKILRPDPASDFLAFSLPDAITVSLSGVDSLVVRSSLAAAKFAGADTDLAKVANEAQVDAVVAGSLVHAGGRSASTCSSWKRCPVRFDGPMACRRHWTICFASRTRSARRSSKRWRCRCQDASSNSCGTTFRPTLARTPIICKPINSARRRRVGNSRRIFTSAPSTPTRPMRQRGRDSGAVCG
jgi:hypothetical protein